MKKITLAKILWKKEKIHWQRTGRVFKKFEHVGHRYTFGVIIAFFGIIFHYIVALWHTLFEGFLFIFARKAFKRNLQRMAFNLVKA